MHQAFESSRESTRDGAQDLTMHLREVEDVLRDIMEDPRFTGHQNYRFEEELNVDEVWLLGGEASAGVAFQIGQIRYIQTYSEVLEIYTA